MWTIPNDVMKNKGERDRLRELFKVVEQSPEFSECSVAEWRVSIADISTTEDIHRNYVEPGRNSGREWWHTLADSIAKARKVAVIELHNRDRRAVQELPKHVAGKAFTFFLDVDQAKVLFVIVGLYST